MPSQASRVGTLIGLSWLSAPYWRAISRRGPKSVRSSSQRAGREQVAVGLVAVGRALATRRVGMTGTTRSGQTCAVPAASATFVTIFSALHRPDAREQAIGVQAEVEDLLQRAGVERRHVQRGERRLAGARQRRALAARVVADERERAAVGVRAREVRVAQRVHRAVEARVLAVPDADHAVVLAGRARCSASCEP